ncbi:MAG TPA: PqiC family protein [Verrucomicrobiae bacterium]|jgi:hypothetical protein|nr:PqiC family protein [Verrucomicrobiae bacterium]
MKKYFKHFIAITFVSVVAAGCASAPSRFYTLNSTAKADDSPAATYAVMVGPVSIPAEVDRPQFTVQVAPNRVAVDEFNRWAAPLNDNIASAVAGDLAVLLGTARVAAVPLANFNADYRVTIDIQQFKSVLGKSATIEAVWVVHKSAGGIAQSGRTVASEPVTGNDFAALAAAHSRALVRVSGDIAVAIRAAADEKP